MPNPILIELTRGSLVESAHAGALAVVRANGEVLASAGDIAAPVFPRSAIKPLQALPLLETGAADRFSFGAPEIAIASGSHSGTAIHVARVASMLTRAGLSEAALGCGTHEPMDGAAARELIRAGRPPSPMHHNCSGKHAAMLATAVHMGEPTKGYWLPEHPVQERIRRVLEDMTGTKLEARLCGIDGCSVPNWAIPLAGLARAFARLATDDGLGAERARHCGIIAQACWAHPELIAGVGRHDTRGDAAAAAQGADQEWRRSRLRRRLSRAGPRLCAQDDRWRQARRRCGGGPADCAFPSGRWRTGPSSVITNWRGMAVGEVRAAPALAAMLASLR